MSKDRAWIDSANVRYGVHRTPWRVHIFVPSPQAPYFRQRLKEAWRESGDSLLVPLSGQGKDPAEYFAGSGALSQSHFERLEAVVDLHPESAVFVVRNQFSAPTEILQVLGNAPRSVIGTVQTFDTCAAALGMRRILGDPFDQVRGQAELLLQAIITVGANTTHGQIIEAVSLPWLAILTEIEYDPGFLFRFAQQPRKFEEFLAAAYQKEGWPIVELTPPRRDGARDVVATRPGFGSVRFLDQPKAYSPHTVVTRDEVRAVLDQLSLAPNTSKGLITTTSEFAPGILG